VKVGIVGAGKLGAALAKRSVVEGARRSAYPTVDLAVLTAPDLGGRGTTEAIEAGHPGLLWVKSLNQLGYHDLDDHTGPLASGAAFEPGTDD